jgi:dephospho-CoA kinase
MIKVGLTGGIGSGKSLVSEIFFRLGIPVFNADKEAKIILNQNTNVINSIKSAFGNVYIGNEIDKKKIASIIFNDPDALKKINSIVHPVVHEYLHAWISEKNDAKYIIEEAAILFESNANKDMDITINVHADELVRINRVLKRDKTTIEDIKNRIKNQLSDDDRIKIADYTIYNNGDMMLLPQVLEIHNKILKTEK